MCSFRRFVSGLVLFEVARLPPRRSCVLLVNRRTATCTYIVYICKHRSVRLRLIPTPVCMYHHPQPYPRTQLTLLKFGVLTPLACLQVEAEGKLYSVPEGVEYNTPAAQASAENWWKVCTLFPDVKPTGLIKSPPRSLFMRVCCVSPSHPRSLVGCGRHPRRPVSKPASEAEGSRVAGSFSPGLQRVLRLLLPPPDVF